MTYDLSQQDPQSMSDEEFFVYAKQTLDEIQRELTQVSADVHALVDKAKRKKILTDIVTKY